MEDQLKPISEAEVVEILTNLAMHDFYCLQTDEDNPSSSEVAEYFDKLTTAAIDEDVQEYLDYEKVYIEEGRKTC